MAAATKGTLAGETVEGLDQVLDAIGRKYHARMRTVDASSDSLSDALAVPAEREAIVEGVLPPGSRLSEVQLAKQSALHILTPTIRVLSWRLPLQVKQSTPLSLSASRGFLLPIVPLRSANKRRSDLRSAPVHEEFDARDETRIVRSEKQSRFGNFVGLPHASHRDGR